jgi:hypothetical protein
MRFCVSSVHFGTVIDYIFYRLISQTGGSMSFLRISKSIALMIFVAAATLFGAEEDHAWSLSGSLYADRDTSVVNIAVTNDTTFNAATIELHYDTTALEEIGSPSYTLLNRATDMSVIPGGSTGVRRIVLFTTSSGEIEAGSGDIVQVTFAVKAGVSIGDGINLSLTRKNGTVLVADTSFAAIGTPNFAPTFTDPGAQAGTQGARFSLQLEASDQEGDSLVYRLLESPADGATLDTLTGLFSWTPRQNGQFTAKFEVSDGTGSDTLSVEIDVAQGNVAPSWPTLSVDTLYLLEGSVFTHTFQQPTDDNLGDVVTIGTGTLPGTATFDPLGLTLSWTPAFDKAGVYELLLSAADDSGLKTYQTVYLSVANVNREPTVSLTSESIEVEEGEPVSFSVSASDPDREAVTLSWSITPEAAGATLSNNVFNWASAIAGTYTVLVTVADQSGLEASASLTITVSDVNEAPVLAAVADTSVEVGASVQIELVGTDRDGDALTYSVILANDTENIITRGAQLAANMFSWTPSITDAGPNLISVRVTDPDGLSDEVHFTITVTADNVEVPVSFVVFETLTVVENDELIFVLPIGDSASFNRDSLAFWINGLPDGAVWDKQTGTITWTPTLLQSGAYTLDCGVSDGSFEDVQQLRIQVLENDVPPVIDPVSEDNLMVDEGELRSFSFSAVDSSSGGRVLFTAVGLPVGAELFEGGLLYYEPGYDASGSYDVTVTATDGTGNTDNETFTLTVNDVNRPVELAVVDFAGTEVSQLVVVDVSATDPDGDDVTLSAENMPSGAVFSSGVMSWTPTESGLWTVLFIGDDGRMGGADSAEVIIFVGDVNRPPVLDPVGAVVVREGEQTSIIVTASDPDENDKVTITAPNLPSGASLSQSGDNPVTATISYLPGFNRQGVFNIKVEATDDDSAPLTVSKRFKLRVEDVDVAPQFSGDLAGSGALELEVDEGDTLNLRLTATDAGGDALTYSVLNLPLGARVESGSTEMLVYSPGYDVVGHGSSSTQKRIKIEVTASDGSQVVGRGVTLIVNDANRPPRIPSLEDQVVDEGSLVTFQVNALDPDGDGVSISTSGRVPYLNAGNPPPARIRDGNVFIFDTSLLPQDSIIRSAVFQFWATDDRSLGSDTVQVEIAIRRDTTFQLPDIGTGGSFSFGAQDSSYGLNIGNSGSNSLGAGNGQGASLSGFANLLVGGGQTLLSSYAGQEKQKGLVAFTFLAGDLESQFYGIRRGWQLDLTTLAAAQGADSLAAGADVQVSLQYNDEDLPTEIPNFTEDRVKVFGYDGILGTWVLADSQSVDTTANVATFKLTNPQLVDYTIGAVLDVVAPVITDLKVSGGNFTINIEDVDTLYSLDGTYQFRVNVTDDEVLSGTGVTLYYAVGAETYSSLAMERTGVNLFTATVTEGVLESGTEISYYIEARDEMNTVLSPDGAPTVFYKLVLAEYTGTPGDLDGNITINIFDLLELLKVLGGNEPSSILSDVDQNGVTNIFDLLELLKLLAK